MISTDSSSVDSSTTLPTSCPPNDGNNSFFLSKFQVSLPSAISALATGVEPSGLPTNFEVTPFDVVCGRGKGSYNRPGNKLFRQIVSAHVDEYLAAKSKLDKSMVLSSIVDQVREQNNGLARFVKKRPGKDGTWYEIGDDHAREKVGHAIREAMSARNAAPKKAKSNQVFHSKQATLLEQQQHIFQDMLDIKQANMLIQAELHQAKNMQALQSQFQALPPPPLSSVSNDLLEQQLFQLHNYQQPQQPQSLQALTSSSSATPSGPQPDALQQLLDTQLYKL